jgi:hypothetical protein
MTDNLRSNNNFILGFLKHPEICLSYTKQDWSLLLRVARNANILAHIGWILKHQSYFDSIPPKVKDNINAAQRIVEYRKQTALWELDRLHHALKDENTDIIILKGGAYLISELPFSQSRMFSDVDILVPKVKIGAIEQKLLRQNWKSVKVDEYDQNYYRQWMHEIPPLRHVVRTIEVDIHHTILPLTSRLKPSPDKLIASAVKSKQSDFKTLSSSDMLLHSATHLFYDSDLDNKLKDLIDLDQLINHFRKEEEHFIEKLIERSKELDLMRPLFYALHFTQKILGTNISAKDLQNAKNNTRIPIITLLVMNILVPLAILPEHPDYPRYNVRLARWLLYIRSHYLRMPLELLIPHLLFKSKVRWEARKNAS